MREYGLEICVLVKSQKKPEMVSKNSYLDVVKDLNDCPHGPGERSSSASHYCHDLGQVGHDMRWMAAEIAMRCYLQLSGTEG